MHIALSRTDNIGDLLFSLPLAGVLKKYLPNTTITLIARDYVKGVADASSYIDNFQSYDQIQQLDFSERLNLFASLKIDSIIMLRSNEDILLLAKCAKIPHIVCKLKNYFYYARSMNPLRWKIVNVNFGPKKSPIHITQRWLKFVKFYDISLKNKIKKADLQTFLRLKVEKFPKVLQLLNHNDCNIVIHPGTNGHTPEWPAENFKALISLIPQNVKIFITGSISEREKFLSLLNSHPNIIDLFGKLNIAELLCLLKNVDGLIANATGPLHLAAALNTNVLGLYPAQPVINCQRWGPIGKYVDTLIAPSCAASEKNKKCDCIKKISVDEVFAYILKNWLVPKNVK